MLVTDGLKNREIAVLMHTSEWVVKNHVRNIFDKLGFWNRTELAMWYVKNVEHAPKVMTKGAGG